MVAELLVLAVLLSPVPPLSAAAVEEARALVRDERAGAVVLGRLAGGRTSFAGLGRISPEDASVPDARTIFEIGSISKVFTGLLLADAVERGRLTLDDPISRLLPPTVHLPDDEDPILLRHLITHTSGLPRLPFTFRPADPLDPYRDYDRGRLFTDLESLVLDATPGERYRYSNFGVGMLGELLVIEAGAPSYERLLVERIARPLGLDDTRVEVTGAALRRFAAPVGRGRVRAKRWSFGALTGAGGVRSTARDLLSLAAALLHPEGRPLEGALRRSLEILHRERGFSLAYAWHVRPDGVYVHSGETGGYVSALAIDPGRGVAACGLASSLESARLTRAVLSLLGDGVDRESASDS